MIWIKISDKKPPKNANVLVTVDGSYVWTAHWGSVTKKGIPGAANTKDQLDSSYIDFVSDLEFKDHKVRDPLYWTCLPTKPFNYKK